MKRLLIVEQSNYICKEIKNAITDSRIEVEQIIKCENITKAYEILKKEVIDLIIIDSTLSLVNDITFIKKAKSLNSHIQIVIISEHNDSSHVINLFREGIKDYLLKPVNKIALVRAIKVIENEYRAQRKKYVYILYKKLEFMLINNIIDNSIVCEANRIIKRYVNNISYVIIVTNYKAKNNIDSKYLYFDNIKGHNIIIANLNHINEIIKYISEEFGYGISGVYNSVGLLISAVKEATRIRKLNFALTNPENYGGNIDNIVKSKDIEKCVQLIGTTRLDEVYKYLGTIVYKIKYSKIDVDGIDTIVKEVVKKVNNTYSQVINVESIDINKLTNIYNYKNIDNYYEEIGRVFTLINKKMTSEYYYDRNKIKIQKAIRYINNNFKENITMAVVSNYVSMNYSVFSLYFKEYTGKNFVSYLRELRLNEAKKLLNETDMKIIEVSRAVGYYNDKHFMRTFKTEYSITPSEYRKNTQSSNNKIYI